MKRKNILIALLCIVCSFSLFARDAKYKNSDYALELSYTDSVQPGDVIAIDLNYKPNKSFGSFFSSKTEYTIIAKAELTLSSDQKILRETNLYPINEIKQNLIGFIPLSTWYTEGKFNIKITYQLFKIKDSEKIPLSEEMEFNVPVTMMNKEYAEETIEFNSSNTAITTNTSKERQLQSEKIIKLRNIVNYDSIFQIESFSLPVTSTRRTSGFGDRRTYKYSNGTSSTSVHNGIDFGVPLGTPVYACASGKVVLAENRITTGWTVVIEHLPGIYSFYYHLSKNIVKEGQTVTQGEQIAESGSTGLSTGPHLHWEIRVLGNAVNPDWFVQKFPKFNTK